MFNLKNALGAEMLLDALKLFILKKFLFNAEKSACS